MTVHATQSACRSASPVSGFPVFVSTIFLSAFLLFLIQPVIAKAILPWFGGVASVWILALLFFQTVLLLGYVYAHLIVKLAEPKTQALVHAGLLLASLVMLPAAPSASWKPLGAEDPEVQVLGLLWASVGLPYFLLSATGPLLQAWYARAGHVAFPYRLFALSNLGSLAALLSYPVLVEPAVTTRGQLQAWSAGYLAFAALCGTSALLSLRPASGPVWEEAEASGRASGRDLLLWLGLSACGTALLLATTNHLCQNVASIPLLWILPLSAYLLSFILCFDRAGWYKAALFRWALPAAVGFMAYAYARQNSSISMKAGVPLTVAGLFVCLMFCQGELARLKPHSRNLTSFYLTIALGGALGSLLVGLAGPHLFTTPIEYPAALSACIVLALPTLYGCTSPRQVLRAGLVVVAALVMVGKVRDWSAGLRVTARNFYGPLSVAELRSDDPEMAARALLNGSITHGAQFLSPLRSREATTYYGRRSGAGLILDALPGINRRVGIIGLGAGTLAAYGKSGDSYRFYELNPAVVRLAGSQFSFLRSSGARIEVVLGDARLSLEREDSRQFDVLVLDAFSGDSIPVHLLTREAFELYFRHLRDGGVLAVHITNKFVNLRPLLAELAAALRKGAVLVENVEDRFRHIYASRWVLMGSEDRLSGEPSLAAGVRLTPSPGGFRLWTDDYSNLLAVLN